MSIEEIIKDLEHTIKYFEGCADKFQRGRKYQAMRTLEQLCQYDVDNRRELLCAFFKYFRDNGEVNIGMTIEEFVDGFLSTQ